jgi:hypothetical protein
MINEASLKAYAVERFKGAKDIEVFKLGSGVHGTGFMLKITHNSGAETTYVLKELAAEGLGHDYPSDRAAVFLLALEEYNRLPRHVRAVDVLSLGKAGDITSIGGGVDYYLLMETASGTDYFNDLEAMRDKANLSETEKIRIKAMTAYLADIHKTKKNNKHLYWRKIRDTIGHGECLMGVFDFYPDGTISYETMAEIEKLCVDWRARLKPRYHRLCQIHGDFHPGNVWFQSDTDFILLDRSRGAFGDAADDITAMSINYLFYSVMYHGDMRGAYREAFMLFFEDYLTLSSDHELLEVLAPFYAFRGAVVCHPLFYPNLSPERRQVILGFVKGILRSDRFTPFEIDRYL